MNRLDEVEQVGMVSHRQAWKQSAPGANAQVQILNATLDTQVQHSMFRAMQLKSEASWMNRLKWKDGVQACRKRSAK